MLTALIRGLRPPPAHRRGGGGGDAGVLPVQGRVPGHRQTHAHTHTLPVGLPPDTPGRDHPRTPMHTRSLLAHPSMGTTHMHTWMRQPEEQPETDRQTGGCTHAWAVHTHVHRHKHTWVCMETRTGLQHLARGRTRVCTHAHADAQTAACPRTTGTDMHGCTPAHTRVYPCTHMSVPLHTRGCTPAHT